MEEIGSLSCERKGLARRYRLTSSNARPHLMHDFTKSSITNNFFNINPINIILVLLDSYILIN